MNILFTPNKKITMKCYKCKKDKNEDDFKRKINGQLVKSCKVCNKKPYKKCEHNIYKSNCIICSPHNFCLIHNKKKNYCIECKGPGICSHKRRKNQCRICTPDNFCVHLKVSRQCVECGGKDICEHKRRIQQCVECGGKDICEHKRRNSECVQCNGSLICEHKKRRWRCIICNPGGNLVNRQRDRIKRILNNSNVIKDKKTIDYIGCSEEFLFNHISKHLTDEMIDIGFHIDHIKPVSKFNLKEEKELKQCCHYTNLQPLLEKDNLSKSNKWSEEDEINWRNNIIQKDLLQV